MTSWQHQIITGTILGSSSIVVPSKYPNYYLTMVDKEEYWLAYKSLELKDLQAETPLVKTEKRWRWRSKSNIEWQKFRENHYLESEKIIKTEVLDCLRDIGLAVWFGDKGYWATKKRIGLRTSAYKEEGNLLIKKYFDEVGMPCEIRQYGNTRRIIFTKVGTISFLKTIANCLPSCIHFKLTY